MAPLVDSDLFKESIKTNIGHFSTKRLHFHYLPAYAKYLLENKLQELAIAQIQLLRKLQAPLFSYFSHYSEVELTKLGTEGIEKLLTALSQQNASAYIENSLQTWVNNQIPQISRNQIIPEDITLLSFVRRKLFRDFMPSYSSDVQLYIGIMEEIDTFLSQSDTMSIKILMTINQELHDQAQQIAHVGNWVWDLAIDAITWSAELFRIYELEPQDRVTYDLASMNHPEDAAMVAAQMERSRKTLEPHDFYYRIILSDGRIKYLHAKGQVITNDQGQPQKFFGTLQDVTIQKQIEIEHNENQHFIEKIAELTPSLIAVYNVQTGKYLFVNKAFETLLGYESQLFMDKGISFFISIIHPEDLSRVMEENSFSLGKANHETQMRQPEQITELRYRLRHLNGEYHWFHTYGTVFERDAANRVQKVINISMDVTEQVVSEMLLQQKAAEIIKQEDRYYRMINEVQDYAILRISKEGIIENWNSGAEKIKGYLSDEIIGKNFRVFYSPEDQKNKLPEILIEQATRFGRATHEGWRVRKDGSKFWGSIVITALHDPKGEVTGFSKVTRDLTHKKMVEDNLREYTRNIEQTNRELEQKNKDLESFTYIASHDLQEPLRKIRIWSSRLDENEQVSENVRRIVSKIQDSCVRMQSLIEGLLDYSQMNMVEKGRELTDLNLVLNDVISDLSDSIEEKNIQIERSALPTLLGVRLQFHQLFSNLISNAIKYRRPEIPLKIIITCSTISEKTPASLSAIQFYKVSISDNGIGFKQEYAEKIFELFQRLHDRTSYSGTGIGLAICKKIVQNHYGRISATGIPGEGATFHIYLPVDHHPEKVLGS